MNGDVAMFFDKRSCLDRAKKLFEQDNTDLLRYICLELRYCIESVVYEDVKSYIDKESLSPSSYLTHWQPDKLINDVCREEPFADQDYEIIVSTLAEPASGGWLNLGKHRRIPRSWLKKHYHKLGSYLHIPSFNQANIDGDQNKYAKTITYLKEVINYLTSIIEESNLGGTELSMFIHRKCKECGEDILINSEAIKLSEIIECRNEKCRARHRILKDDETYPLQLEQTTAKCDGCGNIFCIASHKIKEGFKYECDKCGAQYIVKSFSTNALCERVK
jgi:hypothetical protein